MVFSVKTYNNINQIGLKELGNHFQIDGDLAENPDAYIIRSQNLHDTVFPDNLKAIARAGAGTTISQLTKQLKKELLSSILQVPMLTLLKKLFWPLSYSQHVTILRPMLGLTHLVVTMFLNKLKQGRNSLLVARLLVRPLVLSGLVLLVHVLPMMLTVWV